MEDSPTRQEIDKSRRPAVSVIVPFVGDPDEGRALLDALGVLDLRSDDELIVVDNTGAGVIAALDAAGVRAVEADAMRSSYYARNAGAEEATADWFLFMDSDCRPPPDLLSAYFCAPVPERCGAVAGEVIGAAGQQTLLAKYARSRRHLRQADPDHHHPYKPMAVTANLLVRRAAWVDLGGFFEGIRSAGDSDFSWRLQEAGWELGYRREAAVEHLHRERLGAMIRQAARYGAGRGWVRRRRPDYPRPRVARELVRAAAGIVVWTVTGQLERAAFKALDAVWVTAESAGSLLANVASEPPQVQSPQPRDALRVLVLADTFPALSETFIVSEVRALERLGHRVRVETAGRPDRPNREGARGIKVSYLEDDGTLGKVRDLAWLAVRHPLRCLWDLAQRLRWRRDEVPRSLRALSPMARRLATDGEQHVHAHFAAGAALDAMRLSRLLGVSYSVTAHAYDIFQWPRNLAEKLQGAAFITTGCDYNVAHLRQELGDSPAAARVHRVVMGVDGARFRRRTAYPGGGTVVAVGRLVEKKGFRHLIEAAARLREFDRLERVTIAGDGPLRQELERLATELDVSDRVELLGACPHDRVRELLESADLLAMPCVIAADGDRDSMPVVVKEALAMEVPVVASDEVGLPEVVRQEWGRLVPPGDPAALARAIAELIELPADVRRGMGRAGRAWVLEHADPDREAAKLAELITQASGEMVRMTFS